MLEKLITKQTRQALNEGDRRKAGLWGKLLYEFTTLQGEGLEDIPVTDAIEESIANHRIVLDSKTRIAVVDGRPVQLSPNDAQILKTLANGSPDNPVNNTQLFQSLDSESSGEYTVYIKRLRDKLGVGKDNLSLIRNIRGKGYFLVAQFIIDKG
jgi:DNA-binding response OmpR family regulator